MSTERIAILTWLTLFDAVMKLAAREEIAAEPLLLDVLQTIRAKLDANHAIPASLNDTAMETDA